jgi:hypothetical protein
LSDKYPIFDKKFLSVMRKYWFSAWCLGLYFCSLHLGNASDLISRGAIGMFMFLNDFFKMVETFNGFDLIIHVL